jgi:DedD protein
VERPVKERLVGAAVLMAAAVILIPEMLSGPGRESAEKSAAAEEGAIKTYTIDLSQSPGVTTSTSSPQATDNRAPPPEEVPPESASPAEQSAAEPQAQHESTPPAPTEFPVETSPAPAPEAPVATVEPTQERPEPRTETPPRQIAAQPARAEAPPQARSEPAPVRPEPKPQAKPEVAPKPVASAPSAPTSSAPAGKGWAVQLGSYSSEATAERLMNEWRAKGQSAFVMPVKSGGKTLYRVRIGPTKDRAAAEAALKSVKASIPGAAVVAHP